MGAHWRENADKVEEMIKQCLGPVGEMGEWEDSLKRNL
jgi:hypothetical protein